MIRSLLICAAFTGQSALATVIFVVPSEPLLTVGAEAAFNPIDLDGNGSIDFQFGGSDNAGTAFQREGNNRFLGQASPPPNVGGFGFPLQDNTMVREIAPNGLTWIGRGSTILASCRSTGCSGLFFSPVGEGQPAFTRGFLGVEFEADDGIHYGYIDLKFNAGVTTGFINGWAYESEAGKGITTIPIPEPGSHALLLISIVGFASMRRRTL